MRVKQINLRKLWLSLLLLVGATAIAIPGIQEVAADGSVAKIGNTEYATLEAAVAVAQESETVEVLVADEYTLPGISKNITIKGTVDGVVFNHTTAGNVASIPNGATFKNVTFNFGNVNYHGFQHAGTINMEGCTLNGKLFSYGDMNFTDCSFNQSNSDYHMWAYSGNLTYTDCTFTNSATGKFLNVYNESGATKYSVTATNCKFVNQGSSSKAALNVKATSGSNLLAYDVIINNCTTEGSFPQASSSDALVVLSSVAQVDDRPSSGVDNITVTQDGVLIYPVTVAAIGETKYPTLQAALDAAHEMTGDVTIELIDNIEGYSIVHQKAGLNLTIDGKEKTLNGQIIVIGDGRLDGAETLTIQNIQFEGNTSNFYSGNDAFIQVPSTKTSGTPYYNTSYNNHAHNITISGCTFTGDYPTSNVVGIKTNSGTDGTKNLVMENVTATNLHSLAQLTAVTNASFDNCSATQTGSFIGANGGGGTYTVSNCTFESHPDKTDGYAFREKSSSTAVATLTNNNFKAYDAIILGSEGTINVESGTYDGKVSKSAGSIAISGGYFSEEFPQEYIAAGLAAQGKVCAPATDKEGYFTVGDPHYVAQIGEIKYVSLAAAVEAAQANDVITMIDDDNVSLTTAGSEITINKPLTITGAVDENGKPLYTIYGSSNGALSNSSFNDLFLSCSTGTVTISNVKFDGFGNEISSVMGHSPVFIGSSNQNAVIENVYISNLNCEGIHINGGTFTIKDSNIDCSKTTNSIFTKGICVVNDAQGTIENTTITGVDCDDPNDTSAAIELQGSGNITISGCTIQTNTIGIATTPVGELTAGTSQVTVSDCTIESHNIAIFSDGEKGALTSISSGYYSGLLMAGDNDEGLSISGGLFNDMPEPAYCAEGYAPTDNTDAATKEAYPYTVEELPDVAKIGDVKYKSLQKALDAAHEMTGDVTITLLDNISGYSIVHQKAGLNVTIDGADKTLAGQIFVDGNGRASGTETLTIQNIKFEDDLSNFYSGTDAFILVPSTKETGKPWTTGAYNYAHNITISDCSFNSKAEAFKAVGFKSNSSAGCYNLVMTNDTGNNLHSLAQLTGTTGASFDNCSATLTGSFIGANGGGGTYTVSNCTFESHPDKADGYAYREKSNSTAEATLTNNNFKAFDAIILGSEGTINVENGTYVGEISKSAGNIVISGGKFSAPLADAQYVEFIAEGKCGVNGLYPEEELAKNGIGTAVATVTSGETVLKYASLEAAISAAPDGATVTLLANSSGNGIKVPEGKYTTGLTVDFGGFTYTMDGEMVGSTGTQTQAYQLLKDNKITFKNGTIYSEKAKMLVQNYSDLTLEGMTLTLNNADYASAYTLSNNNGNVVIDGTTINANPAGAFAFDVCRYASYPSVNVTVKGESKINGNIQVDAGSGDPKDGLSLTIEDGVTISGNLELTEGAMTALNDAEKIENTVITKNNDVTLAAPADYKWKDNGDGTSTLAPCVYVAQIGDVKYESLADAVDAVPTDGTQTTITMIANEMIDVVGYAITIPATKNVVLDLNGFEVVGTASEGNTSALITNKGTLTIKDSSDTNADGTGTGKLMSGASPTWTWDGTDDYSGSYASNLIRNEKNLTIESGYLYNMSTGSAAYAIDNYSAGNVTINGGKVDAAKASAIRMFYVNGGSISVTGGVIGHYVSDDDYSYMGIQVMGGTNANVTVTGGTLAGMYALYAGNSGGDITISDGLFDGYVGFAAAVPNINITGGSYTCWVGTWGEQTKFISGGLFAEEVDDEAQIADGYIFTTNTDEATKDIYPYTVKPGKFVAQIEGGAKYETLQDAVNATGTAATTITLLTEAATDGVISGDGVVVPSGSNITFDLNGLTYDVSGETVGSSGTKTSGFQLLKDSDITFKNGTLKATSPTAQMLIQNYSNLTLEDVNLDGTALSGWAYALSNNCGTINLTGSTSITAKSGGRAFDTCKFGSYAIPTVNINTTGAITGPIEATGGKLNIEDGKFNVTWVTDNNYAAGDIQIKGGVFSTKPAEEYCAEGYVVTDNEDEETSGTYPYAVKTKEDAGIFVLDDWVKPYPYLDYTEDKEAVSVTYNRRFGNTNWQALFIPFDINDVSKLTDKYEFAKIHMVALENDGQWTTGDKIEVYYTKITSGKIYANKPYLIKAKKTGEQSIVVENTTLRDTHGIVPMTTSTMAADYIFTGTYVGAKATSQNTFFAMGSGTINYCDNVDLGAYRWYIKPDPKGDNYAKPSISFTEADEDATSISATIADENTEIEGYYSVNGVRSDVPVKGMNIVKYKNGKTKKIMIK